MSDPVIIAIVSSLPGVLISLAALLKIFRVHRELNSRLTEWREETREATTASNTASKAEGVREEKERNA